MLEEGAESAWLESWIRDWSDPLTRFAYALTGSPDGAQDLSQETFVRLWHFHRQHPDQWVSPGWLFTVARNLHRNRLRDQGRNRPVHADPDRDLASDAATQLDILAVLDKWPEGDRTCLWLFYYGDRSVHEVATALRISDSAVKTRLHRARHRFQELWGGHEQNG